MNDSAKRLNDAMSGGGSIELPFIAGVAWVVNGDAKLAPVKESTPALYYGGFSADAEAFQLANEALEFSIPKSWVPTQQTNDNGKSFSTFTTRVVHAAPMGFRESWIDKDSGMRYPKYAENTRHHLQVLTQLAVPVMENGSKVFKPWLPCILSAKGYQASNLLGAFKEWSRKSAAARKALGEQGESAWSFYVTIGTFGPERIAKMVGKGSQQNPITPVGVDLPKTITADYCRERYIGNATVESLAQMSEMADDWLKAWDTTMEPQEQRVEEERVPVAVAARGASQPPEENDDWG